MGPRSDNRGYAADNHVVSRRIIASMGPRSDNRGYGESARRPQTPVPASMGPRSDNRGYGGSPRRRRCSPLSLQWVRGPITAVMACRSWPVLDNKLDELPRAAVIPVTSK